MAEIDEFASLLLEEAKRFLEKAQDASDTQQPHLHAALMLAFCSLEAHTNAIADDFSTRPDLSPADRGVLLEKEVRLEDGEFRLGALRIHRLEDRILFLHRRFGGRPLDRNVAWWSELASAIQLRNQLTHPRTVPAINLPEVIRALQAIINTIDALYQAIYHRPFPAASRRLQSRLSF